MQETGGFESWKSIENVCKKWYLRFGVDVRCLFAVVMEGPRRGSEGGKSEPEVGRSGIVVLVGRILAAMGVIGFHWSEQNGNKSEIKTL